LGRIAARQVDQALLHIPFDLDLVGPWRLGFALDRGLEALGDELLANAGDGPQTGSQGLRDVFIEAFLRSGVGQQEDAGVREFAGSCLPGRNQKFQLGPLVHRQGDPILVHRGTPVLEGYAVAYLSRNRILPYPSNED